MARKLTLCIVFGLAVALVTAASGVCGAEPAALTDSELAGIGGATVIIGPDMSVSAGLIDGHAFQNAEGVITVIQVPGDHNQISVNNFFFINVWVVNDLLDLTLFPFDYILE